MMAKNMASRYFRYLATFGILTGFIPLLADQPELVLEEVVGGRQGCIMDGLSLTVTDNGKLYVLMADNVVSTFSPEGTFIENRQLELPGPSPETRIQALGDHVLLGRWDVDYPFLRDIARHGNLPGQFDRVVDAVEVSDGRLYVADAGNRRIQIFSQGQFEVPESIIDLKESPTAIAVKEDCLAVLTHPGKVSSSLEIYEQNGKSWMKVASGEVPGSSTALTWGVEEGDLFLLSPELEKWCFKEGELGLVSIVAKDLHSLWPNFFASDVPLAAAPDGSVWWADPDKNCLLRWSPASSQVERVIGGIRQPLSIAFSPSTEERIFVGTQTAVLQATYPLNENEKLSTYLAPKELSQDGPPRVWGMLPDAGGGIYARQKIGRAHV